jgi:hypothetical protein
MGFPKAESIDQLREQGYEWDSSGNIIKRPSGVRAMTPEEICEKYGWGCEKKVLRQTAQVDATLNGGGGGNCK